MLTQLITGRLYQPQYRTLGHDIICMDASTGIGCDAGCVQMMLPFLPPSSIARAAYFTLAATPRTFTAKSFSYMSRSKSTYDGLFIEAEGSSVAKHDVKVTIKRNSGFHQGFHLLLIGNVAVDKGGTIRTN
ncbi:hypothetical protein D5086_028244 [Populus alba]|uniref:Uncharacterized protein n=1 Tax=Populus alba TaxID=43335 RepID=A0ACC4AXR2_POPAL